MASLPPAPASLTFTPVLRVLRLCLHALLAGLLALAAVKAVAAGGPHAYAVVASALLMAGVYAAGTMSRSVGRSRRAAAWWLAALGVSWLLLLALSSDALWVAFPLYFLQLHLLPMRWGLSAVAVTAAAAISSFVLHGQQVTPGTFIGPLLGGAVAVATVLGYQALYRESERRRELIDELLSTRAELAEAERAAGTLAERERLAREIHDTLAQGLSSIQLLLRAAERALPADDPALGHIRQAREAAQDNLAEARRFVRALSPPDLEHGSLAAALERLCAPAPTPGGPAVQFGVSGTPVELPTPYEVALLRIAQSALANTVRHAKADRAEITLSFMETSVSLDIVDDGVGFDVGAVRRSPAPNASSASPSSPGSTASQASHASHASDGGFGLPAMRARARSLGGTLSVESAPGQGTAVAITLPLPGPPAAPIAGAVS
ncbi:sensor histidine kinase [Streptomyces sp. NBC_00237]|uniref:sensor histidine kinase n=1 Tax=Streptomyces sp. NBC_00237 TaxID=2975687 RepID=UPI0022597662|nr:sensor histidine kinase [Streptomyces sp. NBC_00237]MCX5203287.1 sensor histidine kinase [Streptomyces sp. NBC_00237]